MPMHLKRKFDTGEFAILAEMEPPKGVDISLMVAGAAKVKHKVDAFIVPEMSSAVMRMSALGGAMVLQKNGINTVMQVCCRDRNRLALQADLLSAYACGVFNLMAVTGEDPSFGDHHQTKPVYDIDLSGLLKAIQSLENGRDMAGIDLSGKPSFLVGSMVNAGLEGADLEKEMEEVNQKIGAGVRFLVTSPVFDLSAIEPFLEKAAKTQARIIPTVLLLKSMGMARYIHQNMKHIRLPQELLTRIQKAPDKPGECVRIAGEMVLEIKEKGFSGVNISPMGWEHKLSDVLEGI
jgi:methylenetetrahydrofolate reductase (NADPH)